jgi:hypothetical protein
MWLEWRTPCHNCAHVTVAGHVPSTEQYSNRKCECQGELAGLWFDSLSTSLMSFPGHQVTNSNKQVAQLMLPFNPTISWYAPGATHSCLTATLTLPPSCQYTSPNSSITTGSTAAQRTASGSLGTGKPAEGPSVKHFVHCCHGSATVRNGHTQHKTCLHSRNAPT